MYLGLDDLFLISTVITMNLQITIEILKKRGCYLARTPELDFVSQGKTPEEAKKNLLEVIKIQFSEMKELGTLIDYLSECGFETRGNRLVSQFEIVDFSKSTVSVA